jgi:hypothetical protein
VHVTITQHGGFAGNQPITLVDVDTATLSARDRQDIERDISTSDALQPQRNPPIGTDFIEYEVVVDDGGSRQSAKWVDDGAGSAEPVKTLAARLQQLA